MVSESVSGGSIAVKEFLSSKIDFFEISHLTLYMLSIIRHHYSMKRNALVIFLASALMIKMCPNHPGE